VFGPRKIWQPWYITTADQKRQGTPIRCFTTVGGCCDLNFLRFLTIFGEKNWRFSQKNNVMIYFMHNFVLFRVKNAIFFTDFWRKYLKNHNIGPGSKLTLRFNVENQVAEC
jgi:hypothetical protein